MLFLQNVTKYFLLLRRHLTIWMTAEYRRVRARLSNALPPQERTLQRQQATNRQLMYAVERYIDPSPLPASGRLFAVGAGSAPPYIQRKKDLLELGFAAGLLGRGPSRRMEVHARDDGETVQMLVSFNGAADSCDVHQKAIKDANVVYLCIAGPLRLVITGEGAQRRVRLPSGPCPSPSASLSRLRAVLLGELAAVLARCRTSTTLRMEPLRARPHCLSRPGWAAWRASPVWAVFGTASWIEAH
jgi:hypothetical protein